MKTERNTYDHNPTLKDGYVQEEWSLTSSRLAIETIHGYVKSDRKYRDRYFSFAVRLFSLVFQASIGWPAYDSFEERT